MAFHTMAHIGSGNGLSHLRFRAVENVGGHFAHGPMC